MKDKWKIRKKGYLKIHIAVNVKSKKILSIKGAEEDKRVHDSSALQKMVKNVTASSAITAVGKLFANDGAYYGNDIFRYMYTGNEIYHSH